MKSIELTDRDHERLMLLAKAWQISAGEVVRRLLEDFVKPDQEATTRDGMTGSEEAVPIYANYGGHRIDAVYYPATTRVEVTSGVLANRSYKSPSGAAIGVVQAYNPNVHPNRNGWSFWFIAENDQALQTIRP